MASMHVTDGLPSKSGTEDGTAFSAVAPSWRPGSRLLIECVDNTSTKADSSILRRLIRMSCWFEPLILRLGPRDFNRPVTATLAGAPAMPFATFGVAPQRDGVVLGLSANTAVADATSIDFAMRATSRDRTARMPSPPACASRGNEELKSSEAPSNLRASAIRVPAAPDR